VTISWTHSLWLIHKKDGTIGERNSYGNVGRSLRSAQDGG